MARLAAVGLLSFCLGVGWAHSCLEAKAQSPEVAAAIHAGAQRYRVSESWMRAIAWCESRFFPGAVSRGGHQGLFQYAPATWRTFSQRAGLGGSSPFDPWAASLVTAWALAQGLASHWACA